MITLLTNILPIALGFFGKLLALKQQSNADIQKLQMQALMARNESIDKARESANKESPWSAWNRRFIIVVILGLIVFTQVAPVAFEIPTVIKTIKEGYSLFGIIELTPDTVEFITVDGLMKFDEIFAWCSMIVEVYFGSQLAKPR